MSAAGVVELVIEEPAWAGAVPGLGDCAETAARLALEAAGLDPAGWSICVLACDDARIAALNRTYRRRNVPTDVLSWPAFELGRERAGAVPARPPAAPCGRRQPLGDVAIALQSARRDARARAIPLKDHATHLILHGCLHLLGFDHETDADAETMEGVEVGALARIGVADPYANSGVDEPQPD